MALGGGTFINQNNVLPGTYINVVSKGRANSVVSDRGIVTMPLELDWGKDGEVFTITNEDFRNNSLKIFGYNSSHEKMKGLRDLFLNARTLYCYRVNSGEKASNSFATAKYSGVRGNDLKVVISVNVNDETKFDVKLYLEDELVDSQTVTDATKLVVNDFVVYKESATLEETAGTPLVGGTNGTATGTSYQNYFDKIESYSFNIMGIASTTESIKSLATNFCKRMRDEIGVKFQVVLHKYEANYEGVISVDNNTAPDLVYWVSGLQASREVGESSLNKVYNGEFEVDTSYTQAQLENALNSGKFVLHAAGDEVRVLKDINSLVSTTENKSDIFKDNQTIRLLDIVANEIANLFNTRYLGNIQNDEDGRTSLKNDIITYFENLQTLHAIQEFDEEDIEVLEGETVGAVVINVAMFMVNVMSQLYMTVTID